MQQEPTLRKLPENVVGALMRHRIKGRPSDGGAEWYCACDDVAEFDTAEEHIARVTLTAEEEDATWAHVIRDAEVHEPAILDDEAVVVVNEALAIHGSRNFIERSWIRPGPVLE